MSSTTSERSSSPSDGENSPHQLCIVTGLHNTKERRAVEKLFKERMHMHFGDELPEYSVEHIKSEGAVAFKAESMQPFAHVTFNVVSEPGTTPNLFIDRAPATAQSSN